VVEKSQLKVTIVRAEFGKAVSRDSTTMRRESLNALSMLSPAPVLVLSDSASCISRKLLALRRGVLTTGHSRCCQKRASRPCNANTFVERG
jgi:hypothetical protein